MKKNRSNSAPSNFGAAARHRSGAVAHMLRMPVATLRVWERRYRLTPPVLSPGGHRLYSAADVRRLALIKQLTDLGHAIGSLATLDMQQLQAVAATHATAMATGHVEDAGQSSPGPARVWRVAVIGDALASRLQRPALLRRLAQPVHWLGPFADAAQAATALQGVSVDAMLVCQPRLHPGWWAAMQAAAPALAVLPQAVLYQFADEATCASLAATGVSLLREPQNDTVLGQWLQGVMALASRVRPSADESARSGQSAAPRRWEDAALLEFAGSASKVACECPRHVAELLIQLSHFEDYSAECAHRSAADAAIHGYLRQVAASARLRFEAALEHVALHEGMMLPPLPTA